MIGHHSTCDELDDEESFYLYDFCVLQKQSDGEHQNINDNTLRCSIPTDLYSLSHTNSLRNLKRISVIGRNEHEPSSSSNPTLTTFDEVRSDDICRYRSLYSN
ncbi:unnamed protein product [Adineta steineri]|uniref:Uncharacterized protein n=1 Tax=Adineta steineri TaxID=433720 RepID=A0A816GBY4_9BILA|nr:unnamed protein product [Adineta steineri]CAF1672213.1 unnamed protein product [Adineta steineri]